MDVAKKEIIEFEVNAESEFKFVKTCNCAIHCTGRQAMMAVAMHCSGPAP